jgi:hypothetical protein
MTELLEKIAVTLAPNDEFECPFDHRSPEHNKKNKIPPAKRNSSGSLKRALKGESHHLTTINISPPFKLKDGSTLDKFGFSPHHLLPGNELWNNKGHPLHAWIHKDVENKVKGDIGYINNAKYNGVDLPGHHMFSGWSAAVADQAGYAFAAMQADTKHRQFHDAHKAYSDMVWNALEKISKKLDSMEEKKGCGKKNCPLEKSKPYDPPYLVLEQLKGVARRLKRKVYGDSKDWQAPLMTSRFAQMYKSGGQSQELARQELSKLRDKMGRPTDG